MHAYGPLQPNVTSSVKPEVHNVAQCRWKTEPWSTNGFKLEVNFHPPSVNSAFHFIARLCRQRSANGTQPNFAKRWTVDRANNLPERSWGCSSLKILGPKNFTFVRFLNDFET